MLYAVSWLVRGFVTEKDFNSFKAHGMQFSRDRKSFFLVDF